MPVVDGALAATFLVHFETPAQMKDWVFNFIGLDFPDTFVDPESNASPIQWMFETYKIYEQNLAHTSPSIIVISSRESYKTLTEAVFSVIAMCHFGATIAHMAAIVPQASAAQTYLEMFLGKVSPYLAHHKIVIESQNSKEVVVVKKHVLPNGTVDPEHNDFKAGMKIIVCTLTGSNSSHTNIFTIDEIDTIRSKESLRAYKEAQMIPGVFNGQFPITIKTSTLKFPGGLFMKEWALAKEKKYKIFKWNLIDITEHCKPERHRPDLPKETRWLYKNLPLRTLTKEQHASLTDKEQADYTEFEAMAGCLTCPLLPVCKERLAKRSPNDSGGLWKPIDFTISQFDKVDPDLAESQLMCWRPSSQGMVYPRFLDKEDGSGNTYTLHQAWERFTGLPPERNMTIETLTDYMIQKGIKFYCGVDWGHTHAYAITVSAKMPAGEWWIVDTYAVPGLEFEQMIALAIKVRDQFKPVKWYCDTSEPMFIKAFRKRRMPSPDFTKDVRFGIECVRGQILDAQDNRRLKVIKHSRNDFLIRMFAEHTFKLDSNGDITDEPDDSEVADVADSLRYLGQNLFSPKGKASIPTGHVPIGASDAHLHNVPSPKYNDWLAQKVAELTKGNGFDAQGKDKSGTVIWNFGDPIDD